MTHSEIEITRLVEELKTAQQEVQSAIAQGLLDAQRPLLRVLKVELIGQIKAVAVHIGQLRRLLRELMEKETDQHLKPLPVFCEKDAPTMLEQVESIVTAKARNNESKT